MSIFYGIKESRETFRERLTHAFDSGFASTRFRHGGEDRGGWRINELTGLTLVTDGTRKYLFGDSDGEEMVDLRGKDSLIKLKGTWAKPMFDQDFSYIDIGFGDTTTSFYLNHCRDGRMGDIEFYYHVFAAPMASTSLVLRTLHELSLEGTSQRTVRALTLSLLTAGLRELEREPSSGSKSRHTWLVVCEYLKHNFQHPINRETVAAGFSLHPGYLSRLFSNHGPGFTSYLTNLRLDHACRLLQRQDLLVEDVARESGFGSAGYFIKVFQRQYGTTPHRYRHAIQSRPPESVF